MRYSLLFKKNILILFLLFLSTISNAQFKFGLANSNYAGVNGIEFNPSSIADQKMYADYHLVGLQLFASNNYTFFQGTLFSIKNGDDQNYYTTNRSDKYGFLKASVMGPSASMVLGKSSIGFTTFVRGYADARRVPLNMLQYANEDDVALGTDLLRNDYDKLRGNMMTYAEFGFSYATIIKQYGRKLWTGGATLKYLHGIAAGSVNIADLDARIVGGTDLFVDELDLNYKRTNAEFGSGSGWGVDLGVTFKLMDDNITHYTPHSAQSNCEQPDYKLKLSASIMNVGSIKYASTVNRNYLVDDVLVSNYDNNVVNSLDDLENVFVGALGGTVNDGNDYVMKLPTSIVLQADLKIRDHIYLGAFYSQTARFKTIEGIQSPLAFAFIPRYERKNFEVAIPISLYRLQKPQVGLSIRVLNGLTIGTDNLVPFIIDSTIYSADIYAHLKISILQSRHCKTAKEKKSKTCIAW